MEVWYRNLCSIREFKKEYKDKSISFKDYFINQLSEAQLDKLTELIELIPYSWDNLISNTKCEAQLNDIYNQLAEWKKLYSHSITFIDTEDVFERYARINTPIPHKYNLEQELYSFDCNDIECKTCYKLFLNDYGSVFILKNTDIKPSQNTTMFNLNTILEIKKQETKDK